MAPVWKCDSGLARKTIAFAHSAEVATRPSGDCALIAAPSGEFRIATTSGCASEIGPGAIAATQTLAGPSATASDCVRWCSPAFEQPYAGCRGSPLRAAAPRSPEPTHRTETDSETARLRCPQRGLFCIGR